ncbi:helicase and polymerase-containing protein TEBICHI-like isoform X1 [Selaginella moellendorffii]|uniref:helicase and polymerase-containing protein TEBICHI-like isoform X1 n=1 Tax=Selaginella moellendorffii TaxID=88036 RepID=UPI000D1C27B4|nr:helicase and polymerase-containing protein TEBICHI-like isoform X1 [Selaginella moellendorffii]|eukprot:XP_024542477.1 helicase and polymerase-containing protein TEBICHI-like isoform X1 [Selaginella moellendorffii]
MDKARLDQVQSKKKQKLSAKSISPVARRASLDDSSPHRKCSLDGFIVSNKSPVSVAEATREKRSVVEANSSVRTSLCNRIEDRIALKRCSTSIHGQENEEQREKKIKQEENHKPDNQPEDKLTAFSALLEGQESKREEIANEFLAICLHGVSPTKKVAATSRDVLQEKSEKMDVSPKLCGDSSQCNEVERAAEMVEMADRQLPAFQHSAKKPPCTPHASAGNGGEPKLTPNWLLDNKYVSPGDSFWDEAIRVLGSKKGDCSEVKSRINPDGPNLLNSPLPVVCFDFASHDNIGKEAAAAPTEEGKAIVNDPSSSVSGEKLSDWLPAELCEGYFRKGVRRLYQWQVDCLRLDGVLDGKSLVYCASTSAGKSLVAEILMLKRVLATGKMAMLVLPYVALCSEKTEHLEAVLEHVGKRVRGYFGTHGTKTLPPDTSLAVCTIEKANSLINKLVEDGRLSELAVVVIDELHMVGDKERGYLLELLLTKLRYAAGKGDCENSSPDGPTSLQIIGMSATMPNVAAVASWLQAAFYETNFRPVPLDEHIKVGNTIYDTSMNTVRALKVGSELGGKDPDHIVHLCHEVVNKGHSVLLFCSSRHACETTARHVAKYLPKFSVSSQGNAATYRDGSEAAEILRKCPAGLDPVLGDTLPAGVAYHHAGLTAEEREVVETCYRQGIVRVLTATSTLAAGVNLPARRVIFRTPKIGRDFLDGTRYRQMAGRAGRAGIDTHGESILICKSEELSRMLPILKEGCQPLQSCLAEEKNGMMRALLEVVAGGIVQSAQDVNRYVRCTLLNSTQPFDDVVKSAQDSLRWLCHKRLIEWDQELQIYKITPLGKAAFGSSLSPEECLVVFEDLAKARESFVLASDLHLVYEVTPIHVELEPDWGVYYQRFVELSHVDQAVASRVGVTEASLMRMAHGAPMQGRKRSIKGSEKASEADQNLRVYRRFFVALILSKLVQEVPLMDVCSTFKVPRGTVQALQDSSGRFAAMISTFCERLGWHDLEGLISKFQNRVSFGVRAEIVGLTEIPFVKAARARALYKAGLRTVEAVAEATIPELANALSDSSFKGHADAGKQQWMYAAAAKKIKNGARRIVLDRAEEARIAAFSAFQALGATIPHSLSQSLYARVQRPEAETDEMAISPRQGEGKADVHSTDKENRPVNMQENGNHGSNAFGGSLIKQDINAQPVQQIQKCEVLDNGPVDFEKMEPTAREAFFQAWQGSQDFFFDLHFEDQRGAFSKIFGFAVCWQESPVYYVRVVEESWRRISSVFSRKGVHKFCWDLKGQMKALDTPAFSQERGEIQFFQQAGSKLNPLSPLLMEAPYIDFRIAAWLLWPDEENNPSSTLEQLVKRRLPGEVAAAASRAGRWTNQMKNEAHNGCCRRAAQIRGLHSVLYKLLLSEALHDPLMRLEMPMVRVLSDMEKCPIGVNMKSCFTARHLLETKLKELESKAQIMAGMNFSLSLPADVADLLYRHLKLPVPPGCAKGKQHPSTDKQALDQLRDRHPVVSLIKEHRSLSKLLHTTIGAVISTADKSLKDADNVIQYINGQWLHTSTGTGRLSMEDPNLQCVEHSITFLLEEHSTGKPREVEVNARQFFVPTQKGWVFLSADYSQIELRLMAHFSGDEALLSLLRRPTGDLFRMMTAKWTSQPETSVTDKQRERTKRMVYGILYGMGISSLAEKMECTVGEASRYHEQFKVAFPGVNAWLQQAVDGCRRNGYVKTLAGRKRYLEKINDSKRGDQAKAERQAVNSICQGSAADLIKMAMIDLHTALVGKNDKTLAYTDAQGNSRAIHFSMLHNRCRLLLQIHDELLLEVEEAIATDAAAIVKACMEGATSLTVPLTVKVQSGPSWGELRPLSI